jgi:hypothetical protein
LGKDDHSDVPEPGQTPKDAPRGRQTRMPALSGARRWPAGARERDRATSPSPGRPAIVRMPRAPWSTGSFQGASGRSTAEPIGVRSRGGGPAGQPSLDIAQAVDDAATNADEPRPAPLAAEPRQRLHGQAGDLCSLFRPELRVWIDEAATRRTFARRCTVGIADTRMHVTPPGPTGQGMPEAHGRRQLGQKSLTQLTRRRGEPRFGRFTSRSGARSRGQARPSAAARSGTSPSSPAVPCTACRGRAGSCPSS